VGPIVYGAGVSFLTESSMLKTESSMLNEGLGDAREGRA
jgi:hypothetical protein